MTDTARPTSYAFSDLHQSWIVPGFTPNETQRRILEAAERDIAKAQARYSALYAAIVGAAGFDIQ